MFLVNFVYDDEELLEPYEWQDDDSYQEFSYLPIYKIKTNNMHDFIYAKLCMNDIEDSVFIVSDTHYHVVVEVKNQCIYKRGTVSFKQRHEIFRIVETLDYTHFKYRVLEEAYDKEFGLTRQERMKKICIEEIIDEIFVVQYDLFIQLCEQLNIHKDNPSEQYLALKQKIEKGYSSIHELLYSELIQKR